MKDMDGWQPIESAPEGVRVMTCINDGGGLRNVQVMKRDGRLWFIRSGMYAYYDPTHWREMTPQEARREAECW